MISPVTNERPSVNRSTGKCSVIPPSNGTLSPAIFGTISITQIARSNPITPAMTLTVVLSSTKSRTTLRRSPPSAIRIAISRRRPVKRTSKRFATLLHAISKTAPTAMSNVTKAGRRSPVASSFAPTRTDVHVESAASPCCSR